MRELVLISSYGNHGDVAFSAVSFSNSALLHGCAYQQTDLADAIEFQGFERLFDPFQDILIEYFVNREHRILTGCFLIEYKLTEKHPWIEVLSMIPLDDDTIGQLCLTASAHARAKGTEKWK